MPIQTVSPPSNVTGATGAAGERIVVAAVQGEAGGTGSLNGDAGILRGGAGSSTGNGGDATIAGGASGSGATGNGGDVTITGGAAASTDGGGGSIIITPGAKAGTGIAGGTFIRSAGGQIFRQQAAPTAETDANNAVAAADMINGICVHTVSTGRTLTTPTGAAISAACPADLAVGDSFDFTVITVGTGADDISTLTAGDANVTFVGKVTVGPDIADAGPPHGTWRFRNTGTNTWIGYRIG